MTSVAGLILTPEYPCRTDAADYQQKCRCRSIIISAFRHPTFSYDFSTSQRKFNTTTSRIWTCKASSLEYRVSLHPQRFGRAGCLSTTSSLDIVQRVFQFFIVSSTDVHCALVFLPQAAWPCRVYAFAPSYSFFKCRKSGLSGIRYPVIPVPEWKRLQMPEPAWYRNKRTQSGTGMLRYRNAPLPDGNVGCPNADGY